MNTNNLYNSLGDNMTLDPTAEGTMEQNDSRR